MNWYLKVLKQYSDFSGRARRKEYWMFVLFNLIISVVLSFVDSAIGSSSAESGMGILGSIYALAIFLPGLAVTVRRLHDTNRSGWWVLIGLIPIIGAIVLIVFLVFDSNPGQNQYGDNHRGRRIRPNPAKAHHQKRGNNSGNRTH